MASLTKDNNIASSNISEKWNNINTKIDATNDDSQTNDNNNKDEDSNITSNNISEKCDNINTKLKKWPEKEESDFEGEIIVDEDNIKHIQELVNKYQKVLELENKLKQETNKLKISINNKNTKLRALYEQSEIDLEEANEVIVEI